MRRRLTAVVLVAMVLGGCGAQGQRDEGDGTLQFVKGRTEAPVAPSDDPAAEPPPPAGLIAYDPYHRVREPAPPMRVLLALPVCVGDEGLEAWGREALAPFGRPSGTFRPASLLEVVDTTPILLKGPKSPACALALASDDTETWELRDAQGVVLGRGVASEPLAAAFARVYERQEAMGGVNFGQSTIGSGQHVAGVWRGERMELELTEIEPRRRALLVVEWAGGESTAPDIEGQMRAERRAAGLSTLTLDLPDWIWALPVPRALPPGYVRCFGPVPYLGFQTTVTEFCDERGDVMRVTTENKGSNPVPDPPTRTTIDTVGEELHVRIRTAVEDVQWFAPPSLGRATLDALLSTVPMLDRRVWFPAAGRGTDLQASYRRTWLRATLERAGATDVEIREQPVLCEDSGGGPPCTPPRVPSYEGEATGPDGERVEFHVFAPERVEPPPSMDVVRALTVGDTDVIVWGTYSPGAVASCGGVHLSLRPEGVGTSNRTDWDVRPSIRLLARVLTTLDC